MVIHESPAAGRSGVVCRKHSPWTMERERKKTKAHLGSPECHEALSEEPEEEEDLADHEMTEQEAQVLACFGQLHVASLLGNDGDSEGLALSRAVSAPDGHRRKLRGSRALSASYHSRFRTCFLNDKGSPVAHGARSYTAATSTATTEQDGVQEGQENVPPVVFETAGQSKCWVGHRHVVNNTGTAATTGAIAPNGVGSGIIKGTSGVSQAPLHLAAFEACQDLTSLKDAAAAAAAAGAGLTPQVPCDLSPAPKASRTHRRSLSGAGVGLAVTLAGPAIAAGGEPSPCGGLADSAETLHGHENQCPIGPKRQGQQAPSCSARDNGTRRDVPAGLPSLRCTSPSSEAQEELRPSQSSASEGPQNSCAPVSSAEAGPSKPCQSINGEGLPSVPPCASSSVAKYGIAAFGVAASVQSCFAGTGPASGQHQAGELGRGADDLDAVSHSGRLLLAEDRVQLFRSATAGPAGSAFAAAGTVGQAAHAPCGGVLAGGGSDPPVPSVFGPTAGMGLLGGASAPLLGAPGRYADEAPTVFAMVGSKALADSAEELELRRMGRPLFQPQPENLSTRDSLAAPPPPSVAAQAAANGAAAVLPQAVQRLQSQPFASSSACASGPASGWDSSRSSASASAADLSSWLASSSSVPFLPSAATAPAPASSSSFAPFDLAGLARSAGGILFNGSGAEPAVGACGFMSGGVAAPAGAQPQHLLVPAPPLAGAGASAPVLMQPHVHAAGNGAVQHGFLGGKSDNGFSWGSTGQLQQFPGSHAAGTGMEHQGAGRAGGGQGAKNPRGSDNNSSRNGGASGANGQSAVNRAAENRSTVDNIGDLRAGDQDTGRRRWTGDAMFEAGTSGAVEEDDDDDAPWLRTSQQAPDPDDPASAGKYSAVLLRRLQAAAEQEELYGAAGAEHTGMYSMYNLQASGGSGLSFGLRSSCAGKPFSSNCSSLEPSPMPRLSSRMRRLRASPLPAGGPHSSASRSSGGGTLTSPAPSHLGLRSRSAGVTPGTERRLRRRSELLLSGGFRRHEADVDEDDYDNDCLDEYGVPPRYDVEEDDDQHMHDDHGVDPREQSHQPHHPRGRYNRTPVNRSDEAGAAFASLSVRLPARGTPAPLEGLAAGAGKGDQQLGQANGRRRSAAGSHWQKQQHSSRAHPHTGEDGFLSGLMDYEDDGIEYSTPPHTPLRGLDAAHEHGPGPFTALRAGGGPDTCPMGHLPNYAAPGRQGAAGDPGAELMLPYPGLRGRGGLDGGGVRGGAPHARVKFAARQLDDDGPGMLPSPPLGRSSGSQHLSELQLHAASEALESTHDFNRSIAQAASRSDRGAAERLWEAMCQRGIDPDIHTLNALLRCLSRTAAHPEDAHRLTQEVCSRGGFDTNYTSHRLLEEICFRFEQLAESEHHAD